MNFTSLVREAAALTAFAVSVFAQKPVFTEDFESGKIDRTVWERRLDRLGALLEEEDEA